MSCRPQDSFYAIDDKKVRQNSIIDVYYRVRLNTGSNKVYYSLGAVMVG
jgi:hypothetical protein